MERAVRPGPGKQQEQLDNLLRGILANRARFTVGGEADSSLHTDVVCYRGLLTTLLATPYEEREGWQLDCVTWRGTTYLCQVETEQRRRERERETERQKRMSSWGYKFEQYCTVSRPGTRPDTAKPVLEAEEFCCLLRTRLAGTSLVYGAEMDAYRADKEEEGELRPELFTELKTSREVETQRQDRNFRRFKLLKWWAQSFLVGTPEILVGWRDDTGLVERLERMAVREIPRAGLDWKPNCCLNFLSELLDRIRHHCSQDDISAVYRVAWQPRAGVTITAAPPQPGPAYFLPDWYTSQVFSYTKLCK